jgi:hypothetical protein
MKNLRVAEVLNWAQTKSCGTSLNPVIAKELFSSEAISSC